MSEELLVLATLLLHKHPKPLSRTVAAKLWGEPKLQMMLVTVCNYLPVYEDDNELGLAGDVAERFEKGEAII